MCLDLLNKMAFKYSPLPDEKPHIRFLHLHPVKSSDDGAIHISLEALPVEEAIKTTYEALSYTWGTSDRSERIHVTQRHQGYLKVTPNLLEILQELRLDDQPRRLWIDAICIDQENLIERSQQVLMMPDIYRNATATIAWLGPGTAQTEKGMKLLQQLASFIKVDWALQVMRPSAVALETGEVSWANRSIDLPFDVEDFAAIWSVFGSPWLERLWVRQEIHLSGKVARLFCGKDFLTWEDFRNLEFCLRVKESECNRAGLNEHLQQRLEDISGFCSDVNDLDTVELLQASSRAKCSDPRDRIFAILSLMREAESVPNLKPDYTRSIGETYKTFVREFATAHNDVDILSCCDLGTRLPSTPSWVPNWHDRNLTRRTARRAAGHSESMARFLDENTLDIGGVVKATISNVGKLTLEFDTSDDIVAVIRQSVPSNLNGKYPTGCSLTEGFCRAICGNSMADDFEPEIEGLPALDMSMRFLTRIIQSEESLAPFNLEEESYLDQVQRYHEYGPFMSTLEGYLGYGPPGAQPGDKVCAALGVNGLLVLRPTTTSTYTVVGPAAFHGLMDAECFLGHLPENYRAVKAWSEKEQNTYYAFLRTDTGVVELEDPRKPPLLNSWTKSKHDQDDTLDKYENIETGEVLAAFDPRLRFDDLLAQGVPMQRLVLV